jgi:uncharacterized membrane protein
VFWLSHHPPEELDRTYEIGGMRVCARCLGTYPMLIAAIAIQFWIRAPLQWAWDVPWAVLLLLPALVDWSMGRFRPHLGSNPWRTATGALLGLALGRTIYVHFQRPLPTGLWLQGVLVAAVAAPVLLLSARRKGARTRP